MEGMGWGEVNGGVGREESGDRRWDNFVILWGFMVDPSFNGSLLNGAGRNMELFSSTEDTGRVAVLAVSSLAEVAAAGAIYGKSSPRNREMGAVDPSNYLRYEHYVDENT